jgi:hypothetical protein
VAQQTQFTVDTVVLNHLMQLAVSKRAAPQARAEAMSQIANLQAWLTDQLDIELTPGVEAHWSSALDSIERFWKEPEKYEVAPPLATPPGQPIGSEEGDEFSVN